MASRGVARRTMRTAIGLLTALSLVACSSGSSGTSGSGGASPSGAVPPPATAAAAPSDPRPPAGSTVQVPASIADDCSADVTPELNDLLARTPDSSTVVFPAHACYRVDETVTIHDKHRLVLDGRGAQLHAMTTGTQGRRHLSIIDSSDVTVRDLSVVGSNAQAGATKGAYTASLAFQHAFNLSGVHRVLLDGVRASHLHGDFVYVGPSPKGSPSTDVTVRRSQFDGSGRQGISITDGDRVLIADDALANVARSMFDLEPNAVGQEARNVRITGNHTGRAVNFWLADKGQGSNVGPIEIDGNTMDAATGGLLFAYGPNGGFRGPWIVRDNQLLANDVVHDEGSTGAFVFSHCAEISLEHNHVAFPAGSRMPAVELRANRTVHLVGDDFVGARQPVLADAQTTGVTVH